MRLGGSGAGEVKVWDTFPAVTWRRDALRRSSQFGRHHQACDPSQNRTQENTVNWSRRNVQNLYRPWNSVVQFYLSLTWTHVWLIPMLKSTIKSKMNWHETKRDIRSFRIHLDSCQLNSILCSTSTKTTLIRFLVTFQQQRSTILIYKRIFIAYIWKYSANVLSFSEWYLAASIIFSFPSFLEDAFRSFVVNSGKFHTASPF